MNQLPMHRLAQRWRHDGPLRYTIYAAVLLGLCTFQPSVPFEAQRHRYLFAIDITQSMNVVDVQDDSRLQAVKRAATQSLAQLKCGSEVGLALFSGHRTFLLFPPVEVCVHYAEIRDALQRLEWRMGWEARSEVIKGMHSALLLTKQIGDGTALAFFTDGHEAPPVNPGYPPKFRGVLGEVKGLLVGVGGDELTPIPKYNTLGEREGHWRRNEVMQLDAYSVGRSTSTEESLVGANRAALVKQVLAGSEHLSSLREEYLKAQAVRLGVQYWKLDGPSALGEVLQQAQAGRPYRDHLDISWAVALFALSLIGCALIEPLRTERALARVRRAGHVLPIGD